MTQLLGVIMGWAIMLTLFLLVLAGAISFVVWDTNPAHWTSGMRAALIGGSVVGAILWNAGGPLALLESLRGR